MFRGQRGHILSPLGRRSDHPHLLPVVGKFFSTVQASDVRAGQRCGLRTPPRPANGYWKAVPGMPATEKGISQFCHPTKKHIHQFCCHEAPSTSRAVPSWVVLSVRPPARLLLSIRNHSNHWIHPGAEWFRLRGREMRTLQRCPPSDSVEASYRGRGEIFVLLEAKFPAIGAEKV